MKRSSPTLRRSSWKKKKGYSTGSSKASENGGKTDWESLKR
jgi:hypothetical protein